MLGEAFPTIELIIVADYLGVFVFAISGGLVAIRNNMDVFGILVVSLLPAIGGGTLRDLLLDTPVFWLNDPVVVCIALLGGIAAIVYKSWTKHKLMVWADALGLALFTMIGTLKAFNLGYGFLITVMMGTITATAGGLIRDIVCGHTPLLLKEDIYAVAALFGASAFYLLLILRFSVDISFTIGFASVFITRCLAVIFNLSLPSSDWIRKKLYRH